MHGTKLSGTVSLFRWVIFILLRCLSDFVGLQSDSPFFVLDVQHKARKLFNSPANENDPTPQLIAESFRAFVWIVF